MSSDELLLLSAIPHNTGYVAYVNPVGTASFRAMCQKKVDVLAEQVRSHFGFSIPHSRLQRLVARTADAVARCTTEAEAGSMADDELDDVFRWYQRQYLDSLISRH